MNRQFAQKGFDLVLQEVQKRKDLRVVLLWRGMLRNELNGRIARLGIADRIEVLDGSVDVNAALAKVHAAAVLAETPKIVKAYPHSLLEALAAGRPVLVSRTIPMSDYVEAKGCGVVVEDSAAFSAALDQLMTNYGRLQQSAQNLRAKDFTLES